MLMKWFEILVMLTDVFCTLKQHQDKVMVGACIPALEKDHEFKAMLCCLTIQGWPGLLLSCLRINIIKSLGISLCLH